MTNATQDEANEGAQAASEVTEADPTKADTKTKAKGRHPRQSLMRVTSALGAYGCMLLGQSHGPPDR